MAYNFQSPFAQALINEGKSRGFNPFSIAASLGNAQIENGLNTNGRPGDNGTAFGGFQWRHDRKQALDATAQKMGLPWDDPRVQAKHWYNEQEGSESRWGLKNAQDIEGATRAGISALRPAGWTSQNPAAGHAYGNRLRATQEAYNYLNGGAAPSDEPVVTGSVPSGATSAPVASGAPPQMADIPELKAPPKEGWEGFMDDGPGALFGKPQEGWNMGDALMGAGIAMMARDNPEGAAALSRSMAGLKRDSEDKYKTTFDPKSGKLIKVRSDGSVSTTQVTNGQASAADNGLTTSIKGNHAYTLDSSGNLVKKVQLGEDEVKPVSASAIKLFEENRKNTDLNLRMMGRNQDFVQMIQNGDVNLDAFSRMGNSFAQFMGDSDVKVQNAAKLAAHIEEMRNARLLEAKGVQTEGDAVRALDALLPGNSKFDKKSVAQLLNGLSADFKGNAGRYSSQYDSLLNSYKNYDPDNLYKQEREPKFKGFDERQKAIDTQMPKFLSEKPTVNPNATPVDGQNPARRTQPTAPSQTAPTSVPKDAPRQPNETFGEFVKRRRGE